MCHTEPPAGIIQSPTVSQPVIVPLPDGSHLPAAGVTGERVRGAVPLLSDLYGPSPFYQHLAAVLASTRPDLVSVAYYGFPVPQASVRFPPPRPLDLVGSLRGPVLAFWGEQDQAVGLEHARDYAARAAQVNPQFSYEIVPGLGHGFLSQAALDDSSDPGGATWLRTLEHLHRHLLHPAGRRPAEAASRD